CFWSVPAPRNHFRHPAHPAIPAHPAPLSLPLLFPCPGADTSIVDHCVRRSLCKLLIHKDITFSLPQGPLRNPAHAAVCALLGAAFLGLAVPAHAQIYSWRDENGNLVLSGTRPRGEVRTYAVPATESVRVTRPVEIIVNSRTGYFDELIDENARRHGIRS